jgi:hypothetical protein
MLSIKSIRVVLWVDCQVDAIQGVIRVSLIDFIVLYRIQKANLDGGNSEIIV